MDADTFLRRALQDLTESASTEPLDEYRMIRSSGLLRLFFADGTNLLDTVQWARPVKYRVHRPDFRVSVVRSGDIAQGLGSGMLMGRWVAARDGHPHEDLSREDFLGHTVASSSWTGDLSVKTIIRVGSIAFGGIHYDKPIDPEEHKVELVLRALDDGREPDTNTLCMSLREISATVVNSIHAAMPE